MVSSAVLGAATGTGLALLLAVTIVMYRYYLLRKRGKEWDELDRWEETRIMRKLQMKVSVGCFGAGDKRKCTQCNVCLTTNIFGGCNNYC